MIQVSGEDTDFPYGDWTAPYHTPLAGMKSLPRMAGASICCLAVAVRGPWTGVEGIRRIKSQDGSNLILSGSCTLTSTLLEHGLADEVLLVVYPVLLGTGSLPSGIIFSAYKVAGPLKTG